MLTDTNTTPGQEFRHNLDTPERCPICGWPMAARVEDGCVPENCSYRPERGSAERSRIEKNLAYARGFRAGLEEAAAAVHLPVMEGDERTVVIRAAGRILALPVPQEPANG